MESSMASSPLTEFRPFPKLPIELRLRVWNFARPDARVIEVMWKHKANRFFTDAKRPAILHACQESREEALKIYEVIVFGKPRQLSVFRQRLQTSGDPPLPSFCIYIDYAHDILYLSTCHLGSGHPKIAASEEYTEFLSVLSSQPAMQKLQRLGFNGGELYIDDVESIASISVGMGSLRCIGFALRDDCCHNRWRESNCPKHQHAATNGLNVISTRLDLHRQAINFKQLEIPSKPKPRRQLLNEIRDTTPAWYRDFHWVADRLRRRLKDCAEDLTESPAGYIQSWNRLG